MGLQNSLTIQSNQRTTWQNSGIVQRKRNSSTLKYTVKECKLLFGKKAWFIIIV